MIGAEQALATLRDYVERSTHWREGGADRHAALQALKTAEQEASPAKTNAQRQAAYRAARKLCPEVRGIFAPKADHARIKAAAKHLTGK